LYKQLRFQRAFGQEAHGNTLKELLVVLETTPKEPLLHALLGQIYQQLDYTQKAILHLNIAMDLDPKEVHALKAIMENFEEPESEQAAIV